MLDHFVGLRLKALTAPENEVPFMAKELQREIMKRLRLRNNFLKTKSQEDRLKHNSKIFVN